MHVLDAVPMPADVMAQAPVIPVEQQTIQSRANGLPGPLQIREKNRRHRQGGIYTSGIKIIHAISLLPAGCFHHAAVNLDLVKFFRMHLPEGLKLQRIWNHRRRQLTRPKLAAVSEFMAFKSRQIVVHIRVLPYIIELAWPNG